MKILTWNVYKDNKRMKDLIDRIIHEDADLVCLQEVPEEYTDFFQKHYPYSVVSHEGWTYRRTDKRVHIFNMILSRYELTNIFTRDVSLNKHYRSNRYTTFTSEFVSASFRNKQKEYQVTNTHLRCVAPPWVRIKQFQEVLDCTDTEKETIICGDLNTFSWPLLNILLWKRYKYSFRELFYNERKVFAEIFKNNNLLNPHFGVATFKLFPVQYDYVLVGKRTQVKQAYKIHELCGSDHYGLIVEID